MVKVFEVEVQVTATLRLAGGGECEYTEAFIVPLNDELPRDAVLPGFISFTESYQRDLRKIPGVVRAAKEHFAREDSATLAGQQTVPDADPRSREDPSTGRHG